MLKARLLFPLVLCLATAASISAQQLKTRPRDAHEHTEPRAAAAIPANAHRTGTWTTLADGSPLNPVHIALMHTGKVLIIQGSGNHPKNYVFVAGIYDPATQDVSTFPINRDMFCNGMIVRPDGNPFVMGGTLTYDTSLTNPKFFTGSPMTSVFDPIGGMFTPGPNMSNGRWYPTGTVLPSGDVMVISGLDVEGFMNQTVEVWSAATQEFTPAGNAYAGVDYFPRQNVLPNGMVFQSGWTPQTHLWNPATHVWTLVATTKFGKDRQYGTSVLLPLTLASDYKPKVLILGGGPQAQPSHIHGTDTTETIDLSVPNPQWEWGPKMIGERIEINATILPNGQVLVSGGSAIDEVVKTAVLATELYDPPTNSFVVAAPMTYARLYHSNTILLPDATVMALGGNPIRGDYEGHIEIYSPPYLFKPDGKMAARPAITSIPASATYGETIPVGTAADVGRVVLMRPGAVTHSFDMEQRLVELAFTGAAGSLRVTMPPNANLAPPGYYMVFIFDKSGVPSVARFVHLMPR
jgi:hypothetical protein